MGNEESVIRYAKEAYARKHERHFVITNESREKIFLEDSLGFFEIAQIPIPALVNILVKLDYVSLTRMALTSKAFWILCTDDYIWERTYRNQQWHYYRGDPFIIQKHCCWRIEYLERLFSPEEQKSAREFNINRLEHKLGYLLDKRDKQIKKLNE